MNNKNILFIEINTDGTIGGSHHCLYEMVKCIEKNKYSPSVVFFQENPLVKDFEKICNVYVWPVKQGLVFEFDFPWLHGFFSKSGVASKSLSLIQKSFNFFFHYLPNLFRIASYLKKNRIDLVHLNNSPDQTDWLLVSKMMGLKVVSHLRFPWSPTRTRKFLSDRYDRIIAISDYVAGRLDAVGVSRENVVTIHDGIDIGQLEKGNVAVSDIRKEFAIPPGAPILCEIGNIRRWKGQHVAVLAMRRLVGRYKDARLFIIGEISNSSKDVEYLKELKELAAECGVDKNVVFTGYRKDALSILSQSDIMVHTSIFPEPMGRVVLEGMVFRKPVVATNHGGPVEILEDGKSGFLVEPENPEALAERIHYLLENREAARRMGESARIRVEEKFGIGSNMKRLEEVYDSLLAEKS